MDGVTWYTATAKEGGNTHNCEAQAGTFTCDVGSLKPYTDYVVELVACDQKAGVPTRICSKAVAWSKDIKTLQSGEFEAFQQRRARSFAA